MQFSLAAAVLAFASSAFAQYEPTPNYHALTKPISNEVIQAGEKFTVEWTLSTLPSAAGPVDLILFSGADHKTLQAVTPKVATGIDPSALKYEWAVDASVGGAKAYGLKIALSSDNAIFQWSNPFTIAGAVVNTTSSSSSSTAAPTSSSSSSSVASLTAQSTTLTTATTPSGNFSTPTGPTRTSAPTTTGGSGSGSQTTPSSTSARPTVSEGAAASIFAGSFAVLGGVAIAVLGM